MRLKWMTLCVLLGAAPAHATGQCEDWPAEQLTGYPDDLHAFAGGHVGVIRPTFPRMFLARAYLAMSGGALDEAERAKVVDLWQRRYFANGEPGAGAAAWTAARAKAGGKGEPVGNNDTNCHDDAFAMATQTLQRIEKTFSAAERSAWLAAQDQVFASCDGTAHALVALPSTATPAARDEREYQVAAARLYAGDEDHAREDFVRIAKSSSPWAPWGSYLAARAVIRQSIIATAPDDPTTKYDAAGLERARKLLVGKPGPAQARAVEDLLGFIDVRLEPAKHIGRVATRLLAGKAGYTTALADWLVAIDHALAEENAADVPLEFAAAELDALRDKSELTDWALTFGWTKQYEQPDERAASDRARYAHAHARWQATKHVPWLLAALAHAPAKLPADLRVTLPRTSPAFDTALYFTMLHAPQNDETRTALDAELALRKAPRDSLRNALLDQRMHLATSLDDAVRLSMRTVIGTGGDCGLSSEVVTVPKESKVELAPGFARAVERHLALAHVVQLAEQPHVPELLAMQLRKMAFARALALGAWETALAIAPKVPDAPPLRPLAGAQSDDARKLAAALVLLRAHGTFDPGALDASLSCPGAKDPPHDDEYGQPTGVEPPDAVFDKADTASRAQELAMLKPLGSSFDIAVRWIDDYATAHPDDARMPQLLYDINQLSHHLRGTCNSSRSSKQAYLVMHRLYPRHALTKKVKYWW